MVEWTKSEVEDYLDWLENHASPEELRAEMIERLRGDKADSLPVGKVVKLVQPHECVQEQ
jgi:hypothetical protein